MAASHSAKLAARTGSAHSMAAGSEEGELKGGSDQSMFESAAAVAALSGESSRRRRGKALVDNRFYKSTCAAATARSNPSGSAPA